MATTDARPILFCALGAMIAIWFALSAWVLRRLKSRHRETFDRLGRPSLIMNNSILNNLLVTRFLLMREYMILRDVGLQRVCDFMLLFFAAYVFIFCWLGVAIW